MKKMNFKPGFNMYNRILVKDYRDNLMCRAAVVVGKGRNAGSHMHSTISASCAKPKASCAAAE